MSPDRSRDSLINTFVGNLEWLAHPDREDRAALARLRRCAGRTIAESREVLDLFYSLFVPKGRSSAPEVELPELRPWEEERFFLVATLFPLAPTHVERKAPPCDFGGSMRQLAETSGVNADGVDRRMAILLDADAEALPFRLRQAARMLGQKGIPINWRRLLAHLLDWDAVNDQGLPAGRVQRRWARSYFNLRDETPGNASSEAEPIVEETVNAH
jgi:CRISPR type I-E-associated protein CasB/Cse2